MRAYWNRFDVPIQQADAAAMHAEHKRPVWWFERSAIHRAIDNGLAWNGKAPR